MNQLAANSTIKLGNKPMVVLPLAEYERMQEDLEMLRSKKLTQKVKKAREQLKKGEVITPAELNKVLKLK